MFYKFVVLLSLICIHQHVNCAMKKSWKSAANFDAEIPKFTPFEEDASQHKEVEVKTTTQAPPSPSPSAETLTAKISSKIKMPPKYVAEVFSQFHQEKLKQDFGAFDAQVEQQSNEIESLAPPALDIEQVLNELNAEAEKEEAEKEDETTETPSAGDDELEITSIASDVANVTQFKVGPLMNVSVDTHDSLVNVKLDRNTLKSIFSGSGSS